MMRTIVATPSLSLSLCIHQHYSPTAGWSVHVGWGQSKKSEREGKGACEEDKQTAGFRKLR